MQVLQAASSSQHNDKNNQIIANKKSSGGHTHAVLRSSLCSSGETVNSHSSPCASIVVCFCKSVLVLLLPASIRNQRAVVARLLRSPSSADLPPHSVPTRYPPVHFLPSSSPASCTLIQPPLHTPTAKKRRLSLCPLARPVATEALKFKTGTGKQNETDPKEEKQTNKQTKKRRHAHATFVSLCQNRIFQP